MTDTEKLKLKLLLKEKAVSILQKRVTHSSAAMDEAQNAANNEDKSTVGDKHETSRSMALLDREIHARQLDAAQKDLSLALQTNVNLFSQTVSAGSYVETDSGNYFFLTGIGSLETEQGKVFFLSINSPIGKLFAAKKSGDEVVFNGRKIRLINIF